MSAPVQIAATGRSRLRLWRDIWGLMKEFWAAHPVATLGMAGLLVAGNARVGVYVIAMGGLIDALMAGGAGERSAWFWVGLYIAASAVEHLYWIAKSLLGDYLRDHGLFRIQRRVLERAAAAPLIQFEEGPFFDHLQRATAGAGERLVRLFGLLLDSLQVMLMLLSVAASLALVHPLLLPLLILGTLPSIWLRARVATVIYEVQRRHTTKDRIREHLTRLLTGREAAGEVRLFGSAGYLLGRWRALRVERQQEMVAAEARRTASTTLGELIAGGAYAGALTLVAHLILGGQLTVGDYVAVTTGALWFQQMLDATVQVVPAVEEQSQFLGDLFDFWQAARREGAPTADGAAAAEPPVGGAPTSGGAVAGAGATSVTLDRGGSPISIEAAGITFAYPGSPGPVLGDVSLRIRPGERIAIVGENGAGKTTLVKLLVGLYQPDRGTVRLDGVPLTEATAPAARRRIAAVFQDYAAFQLTVRENIGFGDLHRLQDDAALLEAAGRAGIADLLRDLPEGLEAYLGRQFGERELSGGQWQRIALARAFLRQADLLVLDEPTAALDPLAELALFERFVELVQGRTAIMISHRLGAARLADRVLVMAHGRIVEEGHHDDLVARGGEYARLFAAQAQWYR